MMLVSLTSRQVMAWVVYMLEVNCVWLDFVCFLLVGEGNELISAGEDEDVEQRPTSPTESNKESDIVSLDEVFLISI